MAKDEWRNLGFEKGDVGKGGGVRLLEEGKGA